MKQEKKPVTLIKNIFLFFIASFMPKAITFFMVPLYTFCLSTEEYGTIDLLFTTIQLLLPILTLQVENAMLRFTLKRTNDPKDVLTIGLRIVLIGSLLLLFSCTLGKIFNIIELDLIYIVFFYFIYLLKAFRYITSYFCRGIDKIGIITVSNVMLTMVTVSCNILFLLAFDWNIIGYLLSVFIGELIGVSILFFKAKLYKYISFRISDKELTKKIIVFSIPMVFSALSWWINTSMDKYILGYFCGASAVGLLAIAYKIPSVLSLLGTVIANAYSVSAIKDFDKNDTDGFLGKSYSMINMFFVIACSFLMLINIFLSGILFSNEFFKAWLYVPPLLVSALVSQMSVTCEQYYIAMKKTKIISGTAIIGAAVNLCLNMILIPKYEAYGAAVATAFSFFTVWLIRYLILTKFIKLKHNFILECSSYVLILLQLILAYFGNRFIICQIIITVCIFILYYNIIKGIVATAFNCLVSKLKK